MKHVPHQKAIRNKGSPCMRTTVYEIYIRNLILPCFIVNFSKYLCLSLLFCCFFRYVCSVFYSDFLLRKYNIFRVSIHMLLQYIYDCFIWLFYLYYAKFMKKFNLVTQPHNNSYSMKFVCLRCTLTEPMKGA